MTPVVLSGLGTLLVPILQFAGTELVDKVAPRPPVSLPHQIKTYAINGGASATGLGVVFGAPVFGVGALLGVLIFGVIGAVAGAFVAIAKYYLYDKPYGNKNLLTAALTN